MNVCLLVWGKFCVFLVVVFCLTANYSNLRHKRMQGGIQAGDKRRLIVAAKQAQSGQNGQTQAGMVNTMLVSARRPAPARLVNTATPSTIKLPDISSYWLFLSLFQNSFPDILADRQIKSCRFHPQHSFHFLTYLNRYGPDDNPVPLFPFVYHCIMV